MAINFSDLGGGGGGGGTITKVFSSSGSWTAPDTVDGIEIILVGGGGGAGGWYPADGNVYTGAGGGGGQVIQTYLPVTPGATYSIAIGAGGAVGTASNNTNSAFGRDGGNSSFGNLLQAGGGGGSLNAQAAIANDPPWRWITRTSTTQRVWRNVGTTANMATTPGSMPGAGRGTNSNNSYATSGGGGGAGGHAVGLKNPGFWDTVNISNKTSWADGFSGLTFGVPMNNYGVGGPYLDTNSNTEPQLSMAGIGKLGFGGGGGGAGKTGTGYSTNSNIGWLTRQFMTQPADGGGRGGFLQYNNTLGWEPRTDSTAGKINTGGGGGGGARADAGQSGTVELQPKAGGSGICIIKYSEV